MKLPLLMRINPTWDFSQGTRQTWQGQHSFGIESVCDIDTSPQVFVTLRKEKTLNCAGLGEGAIVRGKSCILAWLSGIVLQDLPIL